MKNLAIEIKNPARIDDILKFFKSNDHEMDVVKLEKYHRGYLGRDAGGTLTWWEKGYLPSYVRLIALPTEKADKIKEIDSKIKKIDESLEIIEDYRASLIAEKVAVSKYIINDDNTLFESIAAITKPNYKR